MFGLTGAHRTGKSTLAKQLSMDLGFAYYDASVSRIMRELGVNSVEHLTLDKRLDAQEYLLKRHLEDIATMPRPCITDRTPLDFIGYMLAEVTMHNTPQELWERTGKYVEDCLTATRIHYDTVIACRPLPSYEEDPTKPPPNVGYQWELQLIIEGAMMQVRPQVQTAFLKSTVFNERVQGAGNLLVERIRTLSLERHSTTIH
jgi:hypothetical protein